MKKILYPILGAVLLGGICIAFAWVLGALFGPLYQGEEESTRNFKIFLYVFFACVLGGGISGYFFAKRM